MQEGYPITPCRVLRWPQGDRGTALLWASAEPSRVQGSFGSWGGASGSSPSTTLMRGSCHAALSLRPLSLCY